MAVDRKTLYAQVWAEPMIKVAAQYAVSSSYLARICDQLRVPRPPRGYWAKAAVGRAPDRPPLPDPHPGDLLEWARGAEGRRAAPAIPKPPEDTPTTTAAPQVRRKGHHPLIADARQHFEGVRKTDNGYLRPGKRALVDAFVTQTSLERALRLLNTLFQTLEGRGHHVVLPARGQHLSRPGVDERIGGGHDRGGYGLWAPDRPTVTYVGTVAIGLTIFELSEELEVRHVGGKYVPVRKATPTKTRGFQFGDAWTYRRDMPTGRLCLRATSPYHGASWEQQWREDRVGQLSARIPEIVEVLESAAATIAALVEEAERQAEIARQEWQRQRERWEREEAERRRVKNIRESREELAAVVAAWNADREVEAFFDDAARRIAALDEGERESLSDRVQEARALIGPVDALERLKAWRAPDER